MRYQPESTKPTEVDAAEMERLRLEVENLRRQLRERNGQPHAGPVSQVWHPSGVTVAALILGALVLLVLAFFGGYLPLQKRNAVIRAEAQEQEQAVPRVEVTSVRRSSPKSELELPGSIQAITEAPILARADGYLLRRAADIGDRVQAGQLLAEIAAPELDQQVKQAKATLEEARAALEQALANDEQGKSNLELARVTADRWEKLVGRGAVSRQENDQYQAQYRAQTANVQALEKAVAAQRSNIAAAEANVARLNEMQSYLMVKAPFDGVITVRNVDVGALVNSGNTLLFRIAQTKMLRTYLNVPQADASFVKTGQPAWLTVSNLPGRTFSGTVTRTADALDPSSRTMLVEVQVPNGDGTLLPGMYAQVNLSSTRSEPPMLIPADALIARAEGTQVAVVRADHTVHLQKIQPGRDYGDRLEVLSGLQEGDLIIPNPLDVAREGMKVEPVAAKQ